MTIQHVLDRIAVDSASWMVQQANTSGTELSSCVAECAGAKEAAFAAGFAAAEKKLRRAGP